jgi:DeoR family transcriptional regulator, ulaG and ulaABCDEF operon transcriptional repressor
MRVEGVEPERHRLIQEALKERPFATVRDLLDIVGASPATIRRDIAKLHQAGVIRKVFGGIALPEGSHVQRMHARPFLENRVVNVEAKTAIAVEAAKLCRDGDSLIVNGGTTCFLFAQMLARRSVKIFTNSMPLAAWLWENGICHVTIAGGELHREPGVVFSTAMPEPDVFASKFFLGAQALGPEGMLESHPLMVPIITGLAKRADEIIVLADSSKFELRARYPVLPLMRISTLITDDRLSEATHDMLVSEGVEVIVASFNTQEAE